MLIHQKYAWGTQFLEEMNKPAERERDKNWVEQMDNGGKVSILEFHSAKKECEPFSMQITV